MPATNPRAYRKCPEESLPRLRKAMQLINQGFKSAEAARECGFIPQTLWRYLKHEGFKKSTDLQRCSKCKKSKDPDGFANSKTAKSGKGSWCRDCYREHSQKINYGVDSKTFNTLVEQSNSECEICGSAISVSQGEHAIDHCHTTLKVRGLLCRKCNIGLGCFSDNPDLLKAAAKYLEYSRCQESHPSNTPCT